MVVGKNLNAVALINWKEINMKYENISVYVNDKFKEQIETLFPEAKSGEMSIAAAIKLAVAELYEIRKENSKSKSN